MEQLKTLVAPRSSFSESKGDQKAVTALGADCSSKRGCFKLDHQLTNYVKISLNILHILFMKNKKCRSKISVKLQEDLCKQCMLGAHVIW